MQAVKQPSATHAELGTAHTDAEPATQVDGTQAKVEETATAEEAKPAEESKVAEASKDAEVKNEEKKTAAKVSYHSRHAKSP